MGVWLFLTGPVVRAADCAASETVCWRQEALPRLVMGPECVRHVKLARPIPPLGEDAHAEFMRTPRHPEHMPSPPALRVSAKRPRRWISAPRGCLRRRVGRACAVPASQLRNLV